jgi:hypothetical protein
VKYEQLTLLCVPRYKFSVKPGADWDTVKCPKCGQLCYLDPHTKPILQCKNVDMQCYDCALRDSTKRGETKCSE